jgi:serine/threonine protein kinase/Tol biopolymer transport system component
LLRTFVGFVAGTGIEADGHRHVSNHNLMFRSAEGFGYNRANFMAIAIGQHLGSYEITAVLGKGGMGEVYRARDLKLKRDVAIKILPDEFSLDADRLIRFQHEAEVLASLNHPNIAGIYHLEEEAGSRFLVLELIEGETLAERIARGPIPVEETLEIAKHICEALEAAHEKGVIHRDLKPANVKIMPDGKVKVLDFGLAKAMDYVPANVSMSNSPTLTLAGTLQGMILGTAGYMSPEQAKGFNTDQRSDIFSFGCVLYEMLTGRATFDGDTVSEVLASILKTEPDFHLLPEKLNPRIQDLLRRCLEKNPRRRWYAIGDVRVEIEAIRANPMAVAAEQPAVAVRPKPSWKRVVPALLGTLLLGVLAGVSVWYFRPSIPQAVTRFPVTLGEGQQFTNGGRNLVTISPDGAQIVYVANSRLYHRSMQELEARPIPGTDALNNVVNPVFSPDGKSIVFYTTTDATLKKIAVNGGAPVTICPADNPWGMSWEAEEILFGQGSKGIMRVSENGGKPESLVSVKNGEFAAGPQMLPGGKALLFTLANTAPSDDDESWNKAQIIVQTLKSGERKVVIEGGSYARYLSTGHIVYGFGGTLFAVPFDLAQLRRTGGPVPVVEGVRRANNTGASHVSFSNTGTLIYVPGPISGGAGLVLALLDRKGTLVPRNVTPRPYGFQRVSPDGKRIAFGIEDRKDVNVWIYDLAGTSSMRQLTVGGANRYPIWSADGERVAFQSDREGDLGIFWQRADGSGTAERLTKPEQDVAHIPDSWLPNGQVFSYSAIKRSESALWVFSLQDKKSTLFAQMPSAQLRWSSFSPDGRWLAYQSNETGRVQIWVQPFPATGAKYPIVPGGHPFWSPDGTELFYNSSGNQTSVVRITTRPSFSFGVPAVTPGSLPNRNPNTSPRDVDITPDGKYFVGRASSDQTQSGSPVAPQIQVVLNWFEELKQRVPVK